MFKRLSSRDLDWVDDAQDLDLKHKAAGCLQTLVWEITLLELKPGKISENSLGTLVSRAELFFEKDI